MNATHPITGHNFTFNKTDKHEEKMPNRASRSEISLTNEEAAVVKGMLNRGDRQHDIAAWFGVNGGRISEIATGKTFRNTEPKSDNLPPSGPYLAGRDAEAAMIALSAAQETIETALRLIAERRASYEADE